MGSLLIENSGYDKIASALEPRMFFREAHRTIFSVMAEMFTAGKPVDLVGVKSELERKTAKSGETQLEDIGGPAYLASLVDGVPRSTNIRHYAEIVKEAWTRRKLIDIGTGLVDTAYSGQETAQGAIRQADGQLTELATAARLSVGAEPLAQSMGKLIADLDRRVSQRGQISGLPTICKGLDDLTHGWQRKHMIVLAGQTSFGKSILALNVARVIAGAGHRVVYYSFEMERQELEYRLISSLTVEREAPGLPAVALSRILWGNLTDVEYASVSGALEVMHELPIEINDAGARSIADIRAECRQIKAERGLGAIIIDHFQLMQGVEGDNRYEQLAAASRRIKELASELDVPIFVVSQLTLSDKDANREPQLDDLRECKSLGHDANSVWMLHPYKPSEVRSETAVVPFKLLARKQRGGRLGLVTLNLERDFVRFVEADPPAKEPKPKKESKPDTEPLRW